MNHFPSIANETPKIRMLFLRKIFTYLQKRNSRKTTTKSLNIILFFEELKKQEKKTK
jgi:hypothetical protein